MKPNSHLLRRTCREATELIISREDRVLRLRDRLALQLHLLICKACPRFENQVLTMRAALGKWRNYGHEAEAGAVDASEHLPK